MSMWQNSLNFKLMFYTNWLIEHTWGKIKKPSTFVGYIFLLLFTILVLLIIYPIRILIKIILSL